VKMLKNLGFKTFHGVILNFESERGFTLVEALVAVLVASMVILAVQTFFSHGVKTSIKGQDNLETIRAAAQIFHELRKDMLSCNKITVDDDASCTLNVGATSIPPMSPNGTWIAFSVPGATITYSLQLRADGKAFLEREFKAGTNVTTSEFAVPRMIAFKVQLIWKIQQIFPGGPFKQGQVLVTIELDSQDKRFPSKSLKLCSFFSTSQLSSSNWNYFY